MVDYYSRVPNRFCRISIAVSLAVASFISFGRSRIKCNVFFLRIVMNGIILVTHPCEKSACATGIAIGHE